MDSSDSERLRSQFNADWRIQKTDLVDQIGHFYNNEELADVFFVFHRNESTTVFTFYSKFNKFYGNSNKI